MQNPPRRTFFQRAAGLLALATPKVVSAQPAAAAAANAPVPQYARLAQHTALKQSSFDRTGGNNDRFPIAAGQTQELFRSDGPGIISHIWFTISAQSPQHLKELVLRIYWDGKPQPSVEVPVGDFFGLNLGEYFVYQSAFLNCSSIRALNAYFAMPFRHSARITVTNEGTKPVGAFYSNIDYQRVQSLPEDALYFHAQYRQATPNAAVVYSSGEQQLNLSGQRNYVFMDTKGVGQFMGVTMGVLQNRDAWFGEGDDMTFVDGTDTPVITGTGTEDYFCGAWDFGGREGAVPFAHLYNGAPYMQLAERTGGRYCLYRWHLDNPITFHRSFRQSIEHGHANDRADCFYSVAYWYQTEPYTDLAPIPDVNARIPQLKIQS